MSESILQSLYQQRKEQNQKNKEKKNEPNISSQKKVIENDQNLSKIKKLSRILNLDNKHKSIEENQEIQKDYNKWLKKEVIEELQWDSDASPFENHFQIDIENFKQQQLEKIEIVKDEEQINQLTDQFQEKQMEKTLLNEQFFNDYQYKTKMQKNRFNVDGIIMDYYHHENLFELSNNFWTADNEQREIEKIIFGKFDVLFIDQNKQRYEETQSLIISHIYQYLNQNQSKNEKINGFVKQRALILVNYRMEAWEFLSSFLNYEDNQYTEEEMEEWEQLYNSEETGLYSEVLIGLVIKNKKVFITKNIQKSNLLIASPEKLFKTDNYKSMLSSIEIFYIHNAHQFLITDFEKLLQICQSLNQIPDYSQVTENFEIIRPVFVENLGKFFRQTIIYSEFQTLDLLSLTNNFLFNYKGCFKQKNFYLQSIDKDIKEKVEIKFKRFEVNNIKEENQCRFNYWKNQIWNELRNDKTMEKSIILVSNYFQYQELKMYFKIKNSPVGAISEHTPKNKIQMNTSIYSQQKEHCIIKFVILRDIRI